MERLKPVAAAVLALFFAYGILKLVGWILGFTVQFMLNVAFLVLLVVVAVPIYWVLRSKAFRSRSL